MSEKSSQKISAQEKPKIPSTNDTKSGVKPYFHFALDKLGPIDTVEKARVLGLLLSENLRYRKRT